jgi:hypothetical protein
MQVDARRAASLVKAARELLIPGASHNEIEALLAGLKRTDLSGAASLKPLKVKILGNITTDYLAEYVRLMLIRAGFNSSWRTSAT